MEPVGEIPTPKLNLWAFLFCVILNNSVGWHEEQQEDESVDLSAMSSKCIRPFLVCEIKLNTFSVCKLSHIDGSFLQNQILINSSLTALGVKTPLSVIRAEIR
jgi:hypothetical protein